MTQSLEFWRNSPAWLRGWFIANLFYIFPVIALQQMGNSTMEKIFSPAYLVVILVHVSPLVSHIVWCCLGAAFARRWGERKGILILVAAFAATRIAFFVFAVAAFRDAKLVW